MSQSPSSSHPREISSLLAGAGISIFAQDRDLRYLWIENPPKGWDPAIRGKTDFDILTENAATAAQLAKREVLVSGRARWSELTMEEHGITRRFDVHLHPEIGLDGKVTGLLGLILDVTDRHAPTATFEALSREAIHRSKNLLAMVQSLAAQTARTASFPDEFIEQFRGRVQAISRSLDLQSGANGARLSDIITAQADAYVDNARERIVMTGGDFYLSANAALHVGLALHELCAHAAQSGVLSHSSGSVRVSADRAPLPDGVDGSPLRLLWSEAGDISAPADMDAFSKVLLERIAPAAVGGKAILTMGDAGRSYELIIAAAEFE